MGVNDARHSEISMRRHALIVDDSPAARLVLGRMLTRHRLRVESVASAEEALAYLEHERPDVIFMDHQMPGMDGLQALAAIKANPATATIPVMMHTSQQGEVYVGQARALGALGVLPKQLQPVEVSDVLRSLRLIDEDTAADANAPGGAHTAQDSERATAEVMRELLTDLFAQQQLLLRSELREAATREVPAPAPTPPPGPAVTPWRWATALLAVALVAVLALALRDRQAVQLVQPAQDPRPAPAALPQLTAAALAEAAADEQGALAQAWLPALEWALNQDLQHAPEAPLLGDQAADLLRELLPLLDGLGYRGAVRMRTHVGRFCMHFDGQGNLRPLAPELPLGRCDLLGVGDAEARMEGSRQTLGFANTLRALAGQYGHRISIELATAGSSEPLVAYPSASDDLPAGVWNGLAARNHRTEIRLRPAEAPR
jgi:CheY-like chemotaxis protein